MRVGMQILQALLGAVGAGPIKIVSEFGPAFIFLAFITQPLFQRLQIRS